MIEETPLPPTPEGCTGQSIQEVPAAAEPTSPAAPETPPVTEE